MKLTSWSRTTRAHCANINVIFYTFVIVNYSKVHVSPVKIHHPTELPCWQSRVLAHNSHLLSLLLGLLVYPVRDTDETPR